MNESSRLNSNSYDNSNRSSTSDRTMTAEYSAEYSTNREGGQRMESFETSMSSSDSSSSSSDLPNLNDSSSFSSSLEKPKLGLWPMAVMVFYGVSGGPFGIEAAVRTGGNFYALVGFLVMPFCWSLQEALMTAELGTTFPEASGGVAWVEEAFGPLMGWMAGFLSWVSGATDNAIYPVLFLDYLLQNIGTNGDPATMGPVLRFGLIASTTIGLAYVNWRGLDLVGKLSVLICFLAMSPFVILVIVGAFKVDPSRWWEGRDDGTHDVMDDDLGGGLLPNLTYGGVLWRPFLNNLFWNLNSFDSAGCLVAELEHGVSFVRAMMLGLIMVVSCYFLPLLIAIGSSDSSSSDWSDGYLTTINAEVVGPWLGAWTVFSAGISNVGLFQAELSSDAFQIMGMADRGYLPKIFSERSKHGTPTYALLLGTCVIVLMTLSDLDMLMEMLNFNYGFALLFEYAAFFKLRISQPDLTRPYRIPFGTTGCALLFLPTITTIIFIMSLATYETYFFSLGVWITAYLLYAVRKRGSSDSVQDINQRGSYERVQSDELSYEDDDVLEEEVTVT